MNVSLATREAEVLRRVAREYEEKGYRVELEPKGRSLPAFLKGLRPDAVAIRDDERVVIEVKAVSTKAKAAQMRALAARVNEHPGWRLDMVWINPEPSASKTERLPSIAELRERLSRISLLRDEGETAGSFLLLWSALEAVTRIRLRELDVERRGPQGPASLIKDLISFGFARQKDFDRLMELTDLRNALAHGQLETPVSRRSFDFLVSLVERMVEQPAAGRAGK